MPKLPKDPCIDVILKAAQGRMTRQEAKDIIDHFETFLERKKKTPGGVDLADELRAEAKRLAQGKRYKALKEKTWGMLSRAAGKKADARAEAYGDEPHEAIWDTEVGGSEQRPGSRDSIDYNQQYLLDQTTLNFWNRLLENKDAVEMFKSGTFDLEIARELDAIGKADRPAITSEHGKTARHIAEAIHEAQAELVARANRAGAFIRQMPGYLVRQSHDTVKMRAAGFETWKSKMLDRLDHDRTFKGADPEKFLQSVWDAQLSGVRLDGDEGGGASSNLAKKLSEERVLHFKDSDSAMGHLKDFGMGTIRDAVMQGFQRMSEAIPIIERWGPNPKATRDAHIQRLKEKHRTNEKVMAKLNGPALRSSFNLITGVNRVEASRQLAAIGRWTRTLATTSKLGGAGVYGITVDQATRVVQLQYEGRSLVRAIVDTVLDSVDRIIGSADKEAQKGTLAMVESFTSSLRSRWDGNDNGSGMAARINQWFFKANMSTPLNIHNRAAFEGRLQQMLGDEAKLSWGELTSERKTRLGEYSIGEDDWNMLRGALYRSESGIDYMQPGMVRQKIGREKVGAALEKAGKKVSDGNIERFYDQLETKLGTYFADATDMAIIKPGKAELVYLGLGLDMAQAGTVAGEGLKIATQFKPFAVAAFRKQFLRQLKGPNAITGIAALMAMTTVAGYSIIALRDLYKGTKPETRDWTDPKLAANAMSIGGGAGIYGDFLFGQASAADNVLGPTFGPALDIFTGLRDATIKGEPTAALDDTGRKLVGTIPGANLWYTKAALDYHVFYQMYEWMNPGYLSRMEQRRRQAGLPDFRYPPSESVSQ
jgi:hypothetical protein